MTDRPLAIDIRHPLLLKANDLFLLTAQSGGIRDSVPGYGLFFRDTCYLTLYRLLLHDSAPVLLGSSDEQGVAAQIALSNGEMRPINGQQIAPHALAMQRTFLLLDEGPTAVDAIRLRNSGTERCTVPVALELGTRFENLFAIRGKTGERRGRLLPPAWDGETLRFEYEGADAVRRTLLVQFSRPALVAPCVAERSVVHFELSLAPQATEDLVVTMRVDERPEGEARPVPGHAFRSREETRAAEEKALHDLLAPFPVVQTPTEVFGQTMARSLTDVALLQVERGEQRFVAAGVPWFVGLFGRDTLIPSLQLLAFKPDLAARNCRALAVWQGKKDDERTREEPGKILHELRVGEAAHLREVSQTPSYAGVDATLLFLIALARHVGWTGNIELFRDLRPAVDRALGWLERKAAENEAGYVTYSGTTADGQPVNQSWRDSGNGVLRADGSYPEPPLALIEVQGYAVQARRLIAGLLRRSGEAENAASLAVAADRLEARVRRAFWMEDEGCFCLALERDGRQVASVASNTAQVLWTGIATPDQAKRIGARIIQPDMFSGWGVRTLSTTHPRFDPLAYQQGSVWPFDNSLIVNGLRRYGRDEEAGRIVRATLDAAYAFRRHRLPEFIAGSERLPGAAPTHTPRADPMQAWSSGAVPFMLTSLLGLESDGFERVMRVRRPMLPDGVHQLMLHRLEAAGGTVSLRFLREEHGVRVEIIQSEGVEVRVEHAASPA